MHIAYSLYIFLNPSFLSTFLSTLMIAISFVFALMVEIRTFSDKHRYFSLSAVLFASMVRLGHFLISIDTFSSAPSIGLNRSY
jgi:hypothetical protein